MSDPQAQQNGGSEVSTLEHFDVHDGTSVQNALLNEIMHSDLAPDVKTKAVMSIYSQRTKAADSMVNARKAGLHYSSEFLQAIGLNGVLALPAAMEKQKA